MSGKCNEDMLLNPSLLSVGRTCSAAPTGKLTPTPAMNETQGPPGDGCTMYHIERLLWITTFNASLYSFHVNSDLSPGLLNVNGSRRVSQSRGAVILEG